ncbi:MAG: helix-turn-helix transcriptional regulator, partial [Clostridiales bacterium]|nr:helix-turn-helix transcriptional regulator [Clostridiales bacterium]
QPYKFVRLVADEGAAIAPALKKLAAKCERAEYKGNLDPLYVKSMYLTAAATSRQHRGIMANLALKPVKLSKRQKLVIELLAHGHNRKGIMEKTGLSYNTVDTHIRLAYEKLGVNNADDAVLKAHELGII